MFSCLGMIPLAKVKGASRCLERLRRIVDHLSRSYCFIEFRNAADANLALSAMHHHPFDAKHQFLVNRFTDVERYSTVGEEYIEPEPEEYTPRVGRA